MASRWPLRFVRWLEFPSRDNGGWSLIEITVGRLATSYRCREIATDFGPGHHGYELHKLDAFRAPSGDVYHVLLHTQEGWHRCDCLGCEHHGHCKHCAALVVLRRYRRRRVGKLAMLLTRDLT
jgi:hypothetical protein